MSLRWSLVLVVVCGAALVGCASGGTGDGGTGTGTNPGGGTDAARLDGRTFLSVEVTGATLVADTQVQLTFKDGKIGALAGCNSMGGPYTWDGTTLGVTDLAMTQMGCDPARHAQDTWLSDLLTSSPRMALNGDSLVVAGSTSELTMRDRGVVQPDLSLAGTRWTVDTLIEGGSASSVPGDVKAYVIIEEMPGSDTHRASGHTGCNQFGGNVVVGPDAITFGEVISTKMACVGGADVTERAVLALFDGRPITYEIDANRLTLTTPDGNGVSLTAS